MEGDEGGGGSRSRTGSSSSVVKMLSNIISADVSTSLEAGTSSNNVSVHTGHEEADLSAITSTTENDAVEEIDPSSGEEESANQNMVYSKWSEVLQSPSEGDAFSPSREMNRKESLHGIGLTVAIDRAKIVARSGKRCASLLSEVAVLYDNLGLSILKTAQSMMNTTDMFPGTSGLVHEVSRCLTSFAKQMQGLSICLKGSVARPFHTSMLSMGDTVPSIYNKYTVTRNTSFNQRQDAIKARMKYLKAVREAETHIAELLSRRMNATEELSSTRNNNMDDPETCSSPRRDTNNDTVDQPDASENAHKSETEDFIDNSKSTKIQKGWDTAVRKLGGKQTSSLGKSADKLISLLQEVGTYETQYRNLVEEENQAVARAQTMERMALESLQKLEEERLQFFVESLGRSLQAETGALDNMSLELPKQYEEIEPTTSENSNTSPSPSTTPSSFSPFKRRQGATDSEENSGVSEAASLQLPEQAGLFRDSIRSHLNSQSSRFQAIRIVAAQLEEVASATATFVSGVNSRLSHEGYSSKSKTKSSDPLAVVMKQIEGAKALRCWTQVMKSLRDSAISGLTLIKVLRDTRYEHLDSIVLSAEKSMKSISDMDETRWRHLCEASRLESKSAQKYNRSSFELEKAKEFMASVEENRGETATSIKMNPKMTKAIGNVFSMFPSRSEDMTKMLTSNQRHAIAKSSLAEAEQKEAKDKNSYLSTKKVKKQSLASYISKSTKLEEQFKRNEEEEWTKVRQTLEQMITAFHDFRESRYSSVRPATTIIAQNSGAFIMEDIEDWTQRTQQKLADHIEEFRNDEERSKAKNMTMNLRGEVSGGPIAFDHKAYSGFALTVELEDTTNVYKVLALINGNEYADTVEGDVQIVQGVLSNSIDLEESLDAFPTFSRSSSEPTTPVRAKDIHRSKDLPADAPSVTRILQLPTTSTTELAALAETLKERDSNGENILQQTSPVMKMRKNSAESGMHQTGTAKDADTELFLAHFWEGEEKDSTPPRVINSFSCAYWPNENEGYISPLLHGRLFATSETMYFVGWGDKKIMLKWEDVIVVEKASTIMGTVDNAIRIAFDSGDGPSSYFFGSFAFRDESFQLCTQLSTVAKSLSELTGGKKKAKNLSQVPPDEVMQKMEQIFSKKLKNVSIQRFYELCWSEGNKTGEAPFYGPWLELKGSEDVNISDWDFSEGGSDTISNEWCGEKYRQKRVITFKFKRTTHLYVGPPIAGVTQTQYCRLQGNDKCIISMTVEMDGIPYSDCFSVEVRWVARRIDQNDIQIDVGAFVNFKKSSMFTKQIRTGTMTETKPLHLHLFEHVKKACAADSPAGEEDTEEEEVDESLDTKETEEATNPLTQIQDAIKKLWSFACEFGNERDVMQLVPIMAAGVMFILWLSWRKSSSHVDGEDTRVVSHSEMVHLSNRMDELSTDIKEMKELLEKVLGTMQDSQGKISDEL